MLKNTHVKFAVLITIPFLSKETFSCLFLSAFSAILPDYDLKFKIKHRTWTHSLVLYGVAAALLFAWDYNTFFFFSLGYLSHLLLDSITLNGVRLLYPFNKKTFGIKLIRTGATAEKVINAFFVVALILMLLFKVYLTYLKYFP